MAFKIHQYTVLTISSPDRQAWAISETLTQIRMQNVASIPNLYPAVLATSINKNITKTRLFEYIKISPKKYLKIFR